MGPVLHLFRYIDGTGGGPLLGRGRGKGANEGEAGEGAR